MSQGFAVLWMGIGATVVMDLWGITRNRWLGTPAPNYALVGRWIAHMQLGHFRHEAIAASAPKRGEQLLGWFVHYLIGIAYAGILISIWGYDWVLQPAIGPAVAVGLGTVVAPFLLMQPAMGAGVAASNTPNPGAARWQSLVTHLVFGVGLYLSGRLLVIVI